MHHKADDWEGVAPRSGRMAQSAMEYLMTYGWAILIIAVVLGALYSLGVFNMSAYMPKIGPGACHVFRPNGPGTSWNVALTGSCAGYLPQYVAQFNGQGTTYVQVPATSISTNLNTSNAFSVFAWVYMTGFPVVQGSTGYPTVLGGRGDQLGIYEASPTAFNVRPCLAGCLLSSSTAPLNTWVMIGYSYSASLGSVVIYINGRVDSTPSVSGGIPINSTYCIGNTNTGAVCANVWPFQGSIANVQIYNASLTADQVQYLYKEGIGGAPIYLQRLVGWWPLNGDTLDYSGNNNNGVPTNVIYSGTWTSGYFR